MRKLLCAVILISVLFAACACANTAEPVVPEITDEDLYAVEVEEDHGHFPLAREGESAAVILHRERASYRGTSCKCAGESYGTLST